MKHIIIYMKVFEDKDEMMFSGPFYGDIKASKAEANKAAKTLTDDTRSGAIVVKILEVIDDDVINAMERARPMFERIKNDMIEAKQIIDRPVQKSKRRKT